MESFFHTLKTEWVMHCDYKTRDDARVSLFDYMEVFYNRQRRHSSISYEAPLPFEAMKSPGKVSTVRGRFLSVHERRLAGLHRNPADLLRLLRVYGSPGTVGGGASEDH